MRALRPIAALLLLVTLSACPKRVVVNGQELEPAQARDAARDELEAVHEGARNAPPSEKAARLEAFAAKYRGVPVAAEALHEAAALRRDAKDPARAAQDLQALLTEYPLYRRAVEAKYLLALVDLDLGRERDGLATLGSLYAKLPADARPEAAARAADAALSLGADADAVRWLSELARISPPEARAIVDRISKLTFVRPNVVGVAVPLSGPYKRWGDAILQGVGIALEGSQVKLAVRDTRGEPDGAAAALEALALEEGAIVVLGGITNAEAERAASTAEELQLPFVSLSRQEGLTDAGPHVFQNMLTAKAQARALAEF